jgi:hypothetical protein
MGAAVSALAFPVPPKELGQSALLQRGVGGQGHQQQQLVYLTTRSSGHRIPAIHIVRPHHHNRHTIIYSHGNAEDVGLSLPYLDYLSEHCDCNVLAYEYCGYSVAEGEPSERNCYECIRAAYDYLTGIETSVSSTVAKRPVDPSQIVLFGRSLGTGEQPTGFGRRTWEEGGGVP